MLGVFCARNLTPVNILINISPQIYVKISRLELDLVKRYRTRGLLTKRSGKNWVKRFNLSAPLESSPPSPLKCDSVDLGHRLVP